MAESTTMAIEAMRVAIARNAKYVQLSRDRSSAPYDLFPNDRVVALSRRDAFCLLRGRRDRGVDVDYRDRAEPVDRALPERTENAVHGLAGQFSKDDVAGRLLRRSSQEGQRHQSRAVAQHAEDLVGVLGRDRDLKVLQRPLSPWPSR